MRSDGVDHRVAQSDRPRGVASRERSAYSDVFRAVKHSAVRLHAGPNRRQGRRGADVNGEARVVPVVGAASSVDPGVARVTSM